MSAVPAEFLGRARVFRASVAAADPLATATFARIAGPLRARLLRKATPRPDALTDAARAWREQMPAAGRLRLTTEQSRITLRIAELRASAAKFRQVDWDPGTAEPGVAVIRLGMTVAPRRLAPEHVLLAIVSCTRWPGATEAALLADLAVLGDAAPRLTEQPSGTDLALPLDGGRWIGKIAGNSAGARFLAVRSFLPEGWRENGDRAVASAA